MAKLRSRPTKDRKGRIRPYYSIRLKSRAEIGVGRSKRAAELLEAEYTMREELSRHGVKLPSRSSWTMKELRAHDLKIVAEDGGELASRRRRWDLLLAFFGEETPIEDLSAYAIQKYIDSRRKAEASARTVNNDLFILKKALARARDPRTGSGFRGDPFAGIPKLKERPPVKPEPRRREEIDKLLAAARSLSAERAATKARRGGWFPEGEPEQAVAILELLYLTGSRLSQILNLRRDQVIELVTAGKVLRFPPHKRGRPRFFFYRGRLAEILDAIPDGGSPWFFPSQRAPGKPRAVIGPFLTAAAAKAKIPRLTAHALRHSLSTGLLAAGVPISKVQSKLGHKSRRTTEEEYAELFPEVLDAEPPPPTPVPETARQKAEKSGSERKAG